MGKKDVVVTLILSKQRFATRALAAAWAQSHGYGTDRGSENLNAVRFPQLAEEEYDPTSLHTRQVESGVTAVDGRLLPGVQPRRTMSFTPLESGTDTPSVLPEESEEHGVVEPEGNLGHSDTLKAIVRGINSRPFTMRGVQK